MKTKKSARATMLNWISRDGLNSYSGKPELEDRNLQIGQKKIWSITTRHKAGAVLLVAVIGNQFARIPNHVNVTGAMRNPIKGFS